MRTVDIKGRQVLSKQQIIRKQMDEEGMLEVDLEELALLEDACGDWDPYDDDWGLGLGSGFSDSLDDGDSCYDDDYRALCGCGEDTYNPDIWDACYRCRNKEFHANG